jgi:hypothetical protein
LFPYRVVSRQLFKSREKFSFSLVPEFSRKKSFATVDDEIQLKKVSYLFNTVLICCETTDLFHHIHSAEAARVALSSDVLQQAKKYSCQDMLVDGVCGEVDTRQN